MAISIPVARTVVDLRRTVAQWRRAGETVALIPTMGALHEGHLELVRLAKRRCTRAVAINRVVNAVAGAAGAGKGVAGAIGDGRAALTAAGFGPIDYLEVRDAQTLRAWTPGSGRPGRVLAAAWLGKTRLIDNVAV